MAPERRGVRVHRPCRHRQRGVDLAPPQLDRPQAVAPRRRRVVVGRAFGQDHAEAGLVEDVVPLGRRNARIDRHRHHAGPLAAEEGHHPVDAVGQLDRDAVAGPEPTRCPGGRGARHAVAQLAAGHRRCADAQCWPIGVEPVEQRARGVDARHRMLRRLGAATLQVVAQQAGLADAPALVRRRQGLCVFALLGGELGVQLVFGRAGCGTRGTRGEEGRGTVFQRNGNAKQVRRVVGAALDLGEDRRHFDAELRRRRWHVEVVAARQRFHVAALHHREAAEQVAQRGVAALRRGTLVERAAAELDLEGQAHALECRLGVGRLTALRLHRASAMRAAAVRERETFADPAARAATPRPRRAGAADVEAFDAGVERSLAFRTQHV